MPLSVREPPYKIPEYSLTGDLLAYLTCELQYRYHNKGSLPPAKPVQLWFGEFIHAVMEEAFLIWEQDKSRRRFPWNWDPEIREIETRINQRLIARGLGPPPNVFCPFDGGHAQQGYCPDVNHPHKLIASQRVDQAINKWGKHLFPLIDEAEVWLKSIRDMPNFRGGISRCNYYGISGVVDVISSVNLQSAAKGNLILHYLHQNAKLKQKIGKIRSQQYEIVIDYKGMRRPAMNSPAWKYHEWQLHTYSWLRSQQPQTEEVISGIIFYLNELALSKQDMGDLQNEVKTKSTDVMPDGQDLTAILKWKAKSNPPALSTLIREQRSIRIIPIIKKDVGHSLAEFDKVVGKIESCVHSETMGNDIQTSWSTNPVRRTCTACDFKTYCPNPAPGPYRPTIP